MLYVLLLLCAISAISNPITKNEAFDAVFGTSKPAELKSMMRDPQQWWEKRKKKLFAAGRLKSHSDFMTLFTQQTKRRCQKLIKKFGPRKAWFCDLNIFEKHLTDFIKGDRVHLTAKYYAELCNHLLFLVTQGAEGEEYTYLLTQASCEKRLKQNWGTTPPCRTFMNDHMLWNLTESGLFSMLDYLIVLSNNFHLGSVLKKARARDDFSAHAGKFKGHVGALTHDTAHAEQLYCLFDIFKRHELHVGDYTQQCFAVNNTDNILEFGQKILTAFSTLHELVPTEVFTSMEDTLSPEPHIWDPDLEEILPFFMGDETDLDQIPAQAKKRSEIDMREAIYFWREKYLSDVNQEYVTKSKTLLKTVRKDA